MEVAFVVIKSFTRQMIIEDLLMLGCICGQMSVSEFVRKVYPKASEMPTTDRRFGMTTAIDDIHHLKLRRCKMRTKT